MFQQTSIRTRHLFHNGELSTLHTGKRLRSYLPVQLDVLNDGEQNQLGHGLALFKKKLSSYAYVDIILSTLPLSVLSGVKVVVYTGKDT